VHYECKKQSPRVAKQNFSDLVGQDVLVRTLTNAIKKEKLAHGYIFHGIRGTGKTSSARIFAKALNCIGEDGENTKPTATPCGTCENCLAIAESRHMDVIELDAASHTGVDNMRDILEESAYRPMSARYKIFIIDEVHMLSKSAFNAMLKTLEEPPEHVVFILATTELKKVLPTILSRCQKFLLARISVEDLNKHYKFICNEEKIEIEEEALKQISISADGSARDGLSLLDQAISLSENSKISNELVAQMLGKTDSQIIINLFDFIVQNNAEKILRLTKNFIESGNSANSLLSGLLNFIYSLTQVKTSEKNIEFLTTNKTLQQELKSRASEFSYPLLLRIWQLVLKGIEDLKNSNSSHSILDMTCLRIAYLSQDVLPQPKKISEIKTEKHQIEQEKNPVPEKTKKIVDDKREENKTKIKINSVEVLCQELSKNKEVLLRTILETEAKVESFEDGKILLFLEKEAKDFQVKLSKFLKEKTEKNWIIELLNDSKNTTIIEENIKEAKKDDLVNDTLNLFKGSVIESTENT